MPPTHESLDIASVADAPANADEESLYSRCSQSAYMETRGSLVSGRTPGLEASVIEGVVSGVWSLTGEQKKRLSLEIMARLFVRPIAELREEERQETEQKQARFELVMKEYDHGQAQF